MPEPTRTNIDLGDLSERDMLVLLVKGQNDMALLIDRMNSRVDRLESWRDKAVAITALAVIVIPVGVTLIFK
jgi:hypothetical protein